MNEINTRRINILRDSVARRIAAGEVIDRPQAIVRELLDNSIDAGSSDISLYISGGGIDEIRVVDNGSGMGAEDLKKCILPHATSKITDFEDIYSTETLGFRGEALSSIASCSKLTIISYDSSDQAANRIEILDGKLKDFSGYKGSTGTVVSVRDLFYSMPGRRKFLKSASAESGQCRTMFIEKALPQHNITFRYFVDGELRLFLPPSDPKKRVMSAYGNLFRQEFIQSFTAGSDDIRISAVLGTPSLYRRDRKFIHVFINNRRISDYSLVQAVDYAFSSFLPGGCHPVCFLFLDIPPAHVDFNIHPAKREVKFRNLPAVHHTVTEEIGKYLNNTDSFKAGIPVKTPLRHENNAAQPALDLPPVNFRLNRGPSFTVTTQPDSIFKDKSLDSIAAEFEGDTSFDVGTPSCITPLIYHGQIFNLFLVFEYGKDLLIIDQHAAHERIIFDKISSSAPEVQELLVPMDLDIESDEEEALKLNLKDYQALGFELQQAGPGKWLINAMPSICNGMEDELSSFFRNKLVNAAELKKELFAMVSCRTAIKDGDRIDDITAIELAEKVLQMDNPRCPHGRPVIQMFSRDKLFMMFGRTF